MKFPHCGRDDGNWNLLSMTIFLVSTWLKSKKTLRWRGSIRLLGNGAIFFVMFPLLFCHWVLGQDFQSQVRLRWRTACLLHRHGLHGLSQVQMGCDPLLLVSGNHVLDLVHHAIPNCGPLSRNGHGIANYTRWLKAPAAIFDLKAREKTFLREIGFFKVFD